MPKTAVALFETSSTADKVVAHLLKSDFARDEIKVVSRSDFEGKPAPETDILKLGGLPQIHAEQVLGMRCAMDECVGDSHRERRSGRPGSRYQYEPGRRGFH